MAAKGYPNTRLRVEAKERTRTFATASEIRSALGTDSPDDLIEALTALRNQLTVKAQELSVPPQDARLNLVKHWIGSSPDVHDLFSIWDTALIALTISTLSSILVLLSSHYTDHALGQPITKALLSPTRLRRLNSYIGGANNELIIVTLKLYNVLSSFSGGREKKSILEGFAWELKSLPKLLAMRRKAHGEKDRTDPLLRPDIRTHYVLFLLSFVGADTPTQIKALFLEQHQEPFLAIFKGLNQDHYSLARKILEVCWAGIWSDAKLKRTLKVGLFNETTVGHLIKLYERTQAEGDDEECIPANLVHHFLLAICTRPGIGICFKDRAWYARETDGDEPPQKEAADLKHKSGKIYNKILSNVVKTLKVNEDSRQQELAIKILSACPELVSGYWSAAALTLEPRLSSKWITNIAIFGNIISLPLPGSSFYLPNTQLYQPTPPPLSTVIENIFPSVNTKNNFSKGLQSSSGLVQHCTALALNRCLVKYGAVIEHFQKIAGALEEDVEEGQWYKRCRDLEREVRRRVPEFQVVVAFSQQKVRSAPNAQVNEAKVALLSESAQRLLWLYHKCLPSLVAEARFDVGKLLQTFSQDSDVVPGAVHEEDLPDAASRLYRVQKLHVLRLLKNSDQFNWTGKIASLPQTPFRILLNGLTSAQIPSIRSALAGLLEHILSQSILFQEDRHEPDLWLKALPSRRANPIDLQNGLFQSEADAVASFIDDCVQRCQKTPYRYVEALQLLRKTSVSIKPELSGRLEMYPSPLLMTLLEQLEAKINNQSLTPADVIAIASYTRKLLFNLASKTTDLQLLRTIGDQIRVILEEEKLPQDSPPLLVAVKRELEILNTSLSFSMLPSNSAATFSDGTLQDYISEVERRPVPVSKALRISAGLEIVDRVRTLRDPIGGQELKRLFDLSHALDPSITPLILENLIPGHADVWQGRGPSFSELRSQLSFEWLYLHSSRDDLSKEICQQALAESVFSHGPRPVDVTRAVFFLLHGIAASRQQDGSIVDHLAILARILKYSSAVLASSDFNTLKEMVFLNPIIFNDLMMAPVPPLVLEGIQRLLASSVDPSSQIDRFMVSSISQHWFNILKSDIDDQTTASISMGCIWVKYLEAAQLFDLLDHLHHDAQSMPSFSVLETIQVILQSLREMMSFDPQADGLLVDRLPQLLSLKSVLPNSHLLEEITALAMEASLPIGLDGCPPSFTCTDLVQVIRRSTTRWCRKGHRPIEVDLHALLTQPTFSESTVKIITSQLYQGSTASHKVIAEWLASDLCSQRSSEHLVPIFYAFFDSGSCDRLALGVDFCLPFIHRITSLIVDKGVSSDLRLRAEKCLLHILSSPSGNVLDVFLKEVKATSKKAISFELLSLGAQLGQRLGSKAKDLIGLLSERGMQWCIDRYPDELDAEEFQRFTRELISLFKTASNLKTHLVETLLSVIIQHRFLDVDALRLAVASLPNAQLKPVTVNRHLQTAIQHPQFFKVCASSSPETSRIRDAMIEFLDILFHLHPFNTCQISHIEPLVKVYRGTLSTSDLRILSIFQLFEEQRKLSVAALLSRWSSSQNVTSHSALEALQSLDPIIVLRTCLNFPRWRRLEVQSSTNPEPQGPSLYDPFFIMLLFTQMLSDNPPTSALSWIELFRTNIVSLFIRALSAKDGRTRDYALCQIVALWKHMETADLQEKHHVQYILGLIKDLYPPFATPVPNSQYPRQLPTYTTLLLMHAFRAIFNPSNFLYPITARFLLQRPMLDTTDVPLLFGMLYSSSDENWKKERGWMVRFLADGMVSSEDWRVLKRRHTWDLLASLFQSADGSQDGALRMGILEVLANLTCNAQATASLVLKSALLPWIEMQLLHSNSKSEGVEWIKILENILVIVDQSKVEASTSGDWRMIICRCISYLFDETKFKVFPHAVPVILRLALLDGPPLAALPSLLDRSVDCLEKLESTMQFNLSSPSISTTDQDINLIPYPPHRSHSIHQRLSSSSSVQNALQTEPDPQQLYGVLLEMLWRASMTLDGKCAAWEKLTPRMLLWRSIAPQNSANAGSRFEVAEWARREVVVNIAGAE
ncbi:hypothetical protein M413DRAFT_16355 [Hebeloma cylindrosporum]|uniref:Nucleolar pre-ribosomal-associated protein 1 C-terminal domain-containing protein n=1 Tax=Hebeloma cylindrosporum TaxID=76867 RepID=A0A0C2Z5G4_HEBCY|nr:hypothetical protein M413DRAFT_16355 [Hebeloma cylindrosporum h7]